MTLPSTEPPGRIPETSLPLPLPGTRPPAIAWPTPLCRPLEFIVPFATWLSMGSVNHPIIDRRVQAPEASCLASSAFTPEAFWNLPKTKRGRKEGSATPWTETIAVPAAPGLHLQPQITERGWVRRGPGFIGETGVDGPKVIPQPRRPDPAVLFPTPCPCPAGRSCQAFPLLWHISSCPFKKIIITI